MECLPICGGEKLKWFRDAKLGLFLHVGISALGKVDIGWSRKTHKLPDPGEGPIPDEVYDGWANEIKMEDFDADEWIDLAISGGFKYVVIITKHHDGFHMWDTEYSDYKITNAPMARDYIKELTDACHKKGTPMLVTELGMVTEVRPLQKANTPTPMLLTELGMVTEVRLLQPWNA